MEVVLRMVGVGVGAVIRTMVGGCDKRMQARDQLGVRGGSRRVRDGLTFQRAHRFTLSWSLLDDDSGSPCGLVKT